jgi:hypothetical protein
MKLENIHVLLHGSVRWKQGLQYTLNCDFEGARYHVWLDLEHKPVHPFFLFKNPPLGTPYEGPGYFATRLLSLDAVFGKKMVATMMAFARKNNLFSKALEAKIQEEAAEDAFNAEHARIHRIKEAGIELYEACKALCAEFRAYDLPYGSKAYTAATHALNLAEQGKTPEKANV